MTGHYVSNQALPDFPLWKGADRKRLPLFFELELTARCNNNCRHCYINLPAHDFQARDQELSLQEINHLADQALSLGSLWCLITGGEPLLRPDFSEIYLSLKKKGLLVSVFTNACQITEDQVRLFQRYPPRDLEVTVYGVTPAVYERVTRVPGSFQAFQRGLNRLLEGGIKVRLKAMALRSNVDELPAMAQYCRTHTRDYFRFDPLLHLRFDRDPSRNEEIRRERLSPEEIRRLDQEDPERSQAVKKECAGELGERAPLPNNPTIFQCGAGVGSFTIGYDGRFRLCSSLWDPDCLVDLRRVSLQEAWERLVPRVRSRTSSDPQFQSQCASCPLINLCLWCPAHAHLETGRLDGWVEYFCEVAKARVAELNQISDDG